MTKITHMTLRAGTILYHGTGAVEEFLKLKDRPTWFCLNHDAAFAWAGWTSNDTGRRRCLKFRLKTDVILLDTTTKEQWAAVCEAFTDDFDPLIKAVSSSLRLRGEAGWYGRAEIMLTRPLDILEPLC